MLVFYVHDTIIPNGYPELLSKDNRWDKRTFKDKIHPSISETLMYQRLARHPVSVQSIMNHMMFLAGLKASWEHSLRHPVIFVGGKDIYYSHVIMNFMFAEDDEEMTFLPRVPTPAFGCGPPSAFINNEPPLLEAEPLDSVNSEQLVENTANSRGSAIREEMPRKLVHDGSSSRSTRKKSSPAPMETKAGLKDRCYARQAVVDNVVNRRAGSYFDKNPIVNVLRQKIKSLLDEVNEHKSSIDKMLLESQKWAGYQENLATLESKVAALEAEKGKLEAAEALLHKEIKALKCDRVELVSKVRCAALEEVANMKKPFNMAKVKGYWPTYKKEHTNAGNNFVAATFPFISKVVADHSASVEALLSKEPKSLYRPTPTKTNAPAPSAHSQKATPSSAPTPKPMSPASTV
ncbi:hypothetical protein Tco_0994505 [Tanacetum coccineum]